MRIWFGVNRYELKKITHKVILLAIKKPPEGGLLAENYSFIVCFFRFG